MSKQATPRKSGHIKVNNLPSFMAADAGQGMINVEAEDLEIPRMHLVQATSDQVKQGVEPGVFYHNLLERSFGAKLSLVVVACSVKYILFRPRHDGGGILARADDGVNWTPPDGEWEVCPVKGSKATVTWRTAPTVKESRLGAWGSSNPADSDSEPAATKMYCVTAMSLDHMDESPFIITLQRGSASAGRSLFAKLKMARAPVYGVKVVATAIPAQNASGDEYWSYQFNLDGFVTKEVYQIAKEQSEVFQRLVNSSITVEQGE